MGWFDEQIKERLASDQEILEDSFLRLAGVVLDEKAAQRLQDERLIAKEALDSILKYYHEKPVELPENVKNIGDQLDTVLRPTGLMIRDIELTEGWQYDAYGPMLGFFRESGNAVALIPNPLGAYWFSDPASGKMTVVTKKNAGLFEREAFCFYQSLPMKPLGIPDLILYMKKSISNSDFLQIAAATLVVTLVGTIEPKVYSLVTGKILMSKQVSVLIGVMVFLVSAAFASQMLSMVRSLLMERINTKTSLAVEASVMMRILSLPVNFFRKFSSGELSSRAQSVNSLCTMLLDNIMSVGLTSLMSLIYITQIFSFARVLVVPSIIIILSTVIIGIVASLMQIDISRRRMKISAEENGMAFAMLNGIQKIRLSGSEKRVFARWAQKYSDDARLQYNPPLFIKLNSVLVTAISLIGTIVLYYLAVRYGVSVSDYVGFNAAEMAEPILNAEPEVAADKEMVTKVSGSIEVSHVSFRYEENTPYVLKDLSLRIKAGEYVAIVGRTGCGKSTLIRLLLGFEKPETGAVYYDRRDLASLDPRSLRKQIGVVIQNGQLFQGDIFSNITISAPQLTLAEAWEAAETAGIAQDIRDMPMGMQTVISEGQGGVSGGQKQRLMIARAIAPKPKILIFDEATSALDNKTQKQVSDALDRLKSTRVVIAHRLSTIKNCDRILVMDNGAIIEEGTYNELIEKKGAFAELVARQMA